jgi:phage replication-related protein YjqB (UPF0714/DUF867 family)
LPVNGPETEHAFVDLLRDDEAAVTHIDDSKFDELVRLDSLGDAASAG